MPTRPTARYFAVVGCAAGSARPLGTHLGGGVLRLYRSSLEQGSISRGQAPTQRRSMA